MAREPQMRRAAAGITRYTHMVIEVLLIVSSGEGCQVTALFYLCLTLAWPSLDRVSTAGSRSAGRAADPPAQRPPGRAMTRLIGPWPRNTEVA